MRVRLINCVIFMRFDMKTGISIFIWIRLFYDAVKEIRRGKYNYEMFF